MRDHLFVSVRFVVVVEVDVEIQVGWKGCQALEDTPVENYASLSRLDADVVEEVDAVSVGRQLNQYSDLRHHLVDEEVQVVAQFFAVGLAALQGPQCLPPERGVAGADPLADFVGVRWRDAKQARLTPDFVAQMRPRMNELAGEHRCTFDGWHAAV
jgi:hypothetical protein